jgi:hypothetical protein
LISAALSSAPEGVSASAGAAVPDGYHPAVKYSLTRAAAPATPGDAIEVPLIVRVPQLNEPALLSLLAETIDEPGMVTSGLMRPSSVGPQLENEAIDSALDPRRAAEARQVGAIVDLDAAVLDDQLGGRRHPVPGVVAEEVGEVVAGHRAGDVAAGVVGVPLGGGDAAGALVGPQEVLAKSIAWPYCRMP